MEMSMTTKQPLIAILRRNSSQTQCRQLIRCSECELVSASRSATALIPIWLTIAFWLVATESNITATIRLNWNKS